ncbi:gamma-secretase subunit PEN-2-like [Ochotona curzoniae]|uniref:gamma-secretase subunit PEN-2-like n=1 Tax=Ochotona curzoniae TaxID=130825 RepID=UPI001B34C3CA|nr:gamma-secretase subunit PEN-2-like [Ochotona curzoniae]
MEQVANAEKLNLCRKCYLGGFAFLPFLQLVNIFWFWKRAFLALAYTKQSQIKGYVWRSGIALLFCNRAHHLDHHLFQICLPRWGVLEDILSFTVPLGTP